MTGPYADAADLVARSAAAYVSSVPTGPADDGFFGPASITWRLSGDLSSIVAGLRALLVQALHPLAMAGVDQHSDWRRDPVGRLAATSSSAAVSRPSNATRWPSPDSMAATAAPMPRLAPATRQIRPAPGIVNARSNGAAGAR